MCIHGDKSQPERDWVLSGNDLRNFEHSVQSYNSVIRCVSTKAPQKNSKTRPKKATQQHWEGCNEIIILILLSFANVCEKIPVVEACLISGVNLYEESKSILHV